MDWQEKARALESLSEIALKIDDNGRWYVSQNVEIKDGSILASVCGRGETPEDAINDHWNNTTTGLPRDRYLVLNAYRPNRKAVRWNGFMWNEVKEPTP